ncbi:MAG: hypothetical protein BGO51_27590 [Rhodospirillales bacterium 69-11]|nr:TetR family transcriptional regulator [Rhodospirillales bacterium]OJW19132.1 MAG: hypothetical protein BGO51_27590 [Rhodospirillales bacterium 69-11]
MAEAESGQPRTDTRAQIVARAAELFALWGYAGASISDIAAAVGVSKPALYHHFSGKEELYTEIVVTVLSGMLDNARAALSRISDPAERLRVFMRAHADYFESNQHAYVAAQLGFRGLAAQQKERDRALKYRDAYERLLRDLLQDARKSGALRIDDVAVAGRLVLSSLNWMARWYRADGKLRARDFADQYATMLLDGFRPRPSG